MAKIFESKGVVNAWLNASRHLLSCNERTDFNLILEIDDPFSLSTEDREIWNQVNDKIYTISKGEYTLNTVAATIFPIGAYKKYGRPLMYEKFLSSLNRGRKPHGWGTYAERMISHPAKDGKNKINPLNIIVEKLISNKKENNKSFKSTYELGIADPESDLLPCMQIEDVGADLPTYNPAFDANKRLGLPCLSHVSFKLINREKVNMVAIYRSHHYCSKALGNLVGLAHLLNFVSTEAELKVGTLTCISTYATLDVGNWGGIRIAKEILN
ncbi:MAG: hypothetical protein ABSB19_03130 [Methylomonas sp.]|jgi:thymidylate synthase